jgi:thiol-disulfide isomerase/thioredoxin
MQEDSMRAIVLGAGAVLFLFLNQLSAATLHPPVIQPVNEKVPAFTYRSLDMKVHHLAELKGKVVLIDFWGTWCPGCVEEMPTLERLYDRFRTDPKVAFVIVSENDTLDKVKAFVSRNHFTLPFYYVGTDTVPEPLAPKAWPSTYFLSPDGVLRGEYLGGGDWSDESVVRYIEKLEKKYPATQP